MRDQALQAETETGHVLQTVNDSETFIMCP